MRVDVFLLVTLASLAMGSSACRERSRPPSLAAPPPSGTVDPVEACLDAATRDAHTNEFGDPPNTVYAGGTPLFNEDTGRSLTRWQYVEQHHPDLAAKCRRDR